MLQQSKVTYPKKLPTNDHKLRIIGNSICLSTFHLHYIVHLDDLIEEHNIAQSRKHPFDYVKVNVVLYMIEMRECDADKYGDNKILIWA